MRAGQLKHIISIDRLTRSLNENRSSVHTWTNIDTVRAEIVRQSSTDFFTGFGEAESGTIIFRIRYLPGITTADRVTYAGKAYDLKEVTEIGRRRGLELRAVATS